MRIRNILYATVIAALLVLAVATPQPAYAWGGGCGSYVVRWGDTLFSIGMQYGMSVAAMRQANPNLGYWLYAGQTISIPCGGQDGGYNGQSQGNNGGCGYGQGCDGNGYQNQGCGYGQGCDGNGYQNQGYQNQGCGYGQGCDGNGYQNQGYGYQGQGDSYQGQWDGNQGHGYQGQDANYGGCSSGCGYGNGTYVVQRGDTLAKIAARFGTSWYQLCVLNGLWNPNLIYAGQVIRVR